MATILDNSIIKDFFLGSGALMLKNQYHLPYKFICPQKNALIHVSRVYAKKSELVSIGEFKFAPIIFSPSPQRRSSFPKTYV